MLQVDMPIQIPSMGRHLPVVEIQEKQVMSPFPLSDQKPGRRGQNIHRDFNPLLLSMEQNLKNNRTN